MFGLPAFAWKLIGVGALVLGVWFYFSRVSAWHEAFQKLPAVEQELKDERDCIKGSTCDKKSEARANEAAAQAAQAASTAVAAALASEEATRREAAAWRERFRSAKVASPECAAWAAAKVGCPL